MKKIFLMFVCFGTFHTLIAQDKKVQQSETIIIEDDKKIKSGNTTIEIKDGDGNYMYNLKYLPQNIVQITQYSSRQKKIITSRLTINKNGQIINNFNEGNNFTHEFIYNEKGEMVEEKSQFKSEEPNFLTYEYIK